MLEAEDLAEQENKELASRLESLESIVRMLELKHKNSVEHASRLEERETDLKKVRRKVIPVVNPYLKLFSLNRNTHVCMSAIRSCSRTMWTTWNVPKC